MKAKDKIIQWIKQEVKKAGAKGVVLGLSGGVDSASVAFLAKKALGENVLALILPCHSKAVDIKDAKYTAKRFGIKTRTVDLTSTYDRLIKIFPPGNRLAQGNLKPRLRMLTLYYFANKLNYLVAGTGNKSEYLVGYFTKFGDGGVDILPIGDLYKTQVRQLAKELGVPRRIIDKTPSAGLWSGQTDEGELGITYAKLDSILMASRKKKASLYSAREVKRVHNLVAASQHKRQPPKICKIK